MSSYRGGDHSFQSPPDLNFKIRQFSTADKYTNLQSTTQRLEMFMHQNQFLKGCLANLGITSPEQIEQLTNHNRSKKNKEERMTLDSAANELIHWDLMQKNKYLQNKIDRLKQQKCKQEESLVKIKNSTKWRNRSECNPISCYRDKYMKLLRLRCPDTQF